MTEQNMYAYFMDNVPGIGGKTAERLLEEYGTPEEIYREKDERLLPLLGRKRLSDWKQLKEVWDLEERYGELQKLGVRFIPVCHRAYPRRLREIPDKPFALYVKGSLPSEDMPAAAVVGTRNCTEYGRFVAEEFGRALAAAGIAVVSGLARGIDGISQQAVLEAGGETYGVLGCGVDVCYPACHRSLYEQMTAKGGVISSYPLHTQPKSTLFPPRNRIISGLADAVLVVEASAKSGTLITVDMALEQGKDIYCVPGRLTDRMSHGCNRLIRQGAAMALSPQDFIAGITAQAVSLSGIRKQRREEAAEYLDNFPPPEGLLPEEQKIWELLEDCPVSLDRIRMKMAEKEDLSGISLQQTLHILMSLVLLGLAEQSGGSHYHKKRRR